MKVFSPTRLLAIAALAFALPVAAQATVVETFDWVSGGQTPENPASAKTGTSSGTLQLTFSSWSLTTPAANPNLGPYYTSGGTTATITGFSYTDGDGLSVGLSNITSSKTLTTTSTSWATSATDTPFNAPAGAGYYLTSGFTFSGTTSAGTMFSIANGAGTAGANYQNGVGNAGNNFNAAPGFAAIADGGYWKLETISAVPLPAALPLLLAGIGGLGAFRRRKLATT